MTEPEQEDEREQGREQHSGAVVNTIKYSFRLVALLVFALVVGLLLYDLWPYLTASVRLNQARKIVSVGRDWAVAEKELIACGFQVDRHEDGAFVDWGGSELVDIANPLLERVAPNFRAEHNDKFDFPYVSVEVDSTGKIIRLAAPFEPWF